MENTGSNSAFGKLLAGLGLLFAALTTGCVVLAGAVDETSMPVIVCVWLAAAICAAVGLIVSA